MALSLARRNSRQRYWPSLRLSAERWLPRMVARLSRPTRSRHWRYAAHALRRHDARHDLRLFSSSTTLILALLLWRRASWIPEALRSFTEFNRYFFLLVLFSLTFHLLSGTQCLRAGEFQPRTKIEAGLGTDPASSLQRLASRIAAAMRLFLFPALEANKRRF